MEKDHFEDELQKLKHNYHYLIIGILAAFLFWPLDVFIDAGFFYEKSFLDELFHPSETEVYFRLLVSTLLFSLGVATHHADKTKELMLHYKRSEEMIRESQHRKANILETALDSILCIDEAGTIIEFNPAAEKTFGYTRADVLDKQAVDLLVPTHLRQKITQGFEQFKATNEGPVINARTETIGLHCNGTEIPIELTVTHSEYGFFTASIRNLTESKEMESKFLQAQKMDAIGTLVGGIAHDFNNMLAGMTCSLYLAKLRAKEMPEVVQLLGNVESISFRASEMIQQLLTFARRDQVSMKVLPLNTLFKETLKLLRTSVQEHIEIDQEACSEPLLINGDATQIHQMLMNLVNNSCDALEGTDKPRIIIRLESLHVDDLFVKSHPYAETGHYAHLSVEDNGCGIPSHQIEHLFEPFFTTKDEGKGTGLGLAMVYGAVKTHHGFIEVNSSEGEQTTFHIYIPLIEEKIIASNASAKSPIPKGHGETILLVEDADTIRKAGEMVLEELGYQVLTATNGQQAVEVFANHSETISLAILDVVMPVMGGVKAAECMRQINPHVHVIFSTAYDKHLQVDMENETVLSKPFSIAGLSHLIREKIDA